MDLVEAGRTLGDSIRWVGGWNCPVTDETIHGIAPIGHRRVVESTVEGQIESHHASNGDRYVGKVADAFTILECRVALKATPAVLSLTTWCCNSICFTLAADYSSSAR